MLSPMEVRPYLRRKNRYTTSEKELLAVVKGVEAYRPYLVGGKFTIYTDHRALVGLKSAKHTGRLERWALKLQEYDFEIIHRPGKNNFVADALSRRPYPEEQENITIATPPINSICLTESSDEENDIEKVCVQVNLFYDPSETDIVVLEEDHLQPVLDNRKSLAQLQRECPDFKDIIRYVEKQDLPQDTSKHNSI